jgi:hypothetical protein
MGFIFVYFLFTSLDLLEILSLLNKQTPLFLRVLYKGAVSSPLTDSVYWSEEKYSMTDALHQSEASLLL